MQLGSFSRTFLCGTALISMSVSVHAKQATQLDVITVTVNKIKQILSQVAGGVSVETKKEKDLYGQQTVKQVVSGMPGVSARQSATDPATAINIRGLQDFGRVNVTIDGARQDFQRSGHNSNGMFYFEPEQMQQVTVTRGPIANVYGSGAIGGVVSFDTLDALSFLKAGENMAGSEKLSYATNGGNVLSSTTGALRFGDAGGFLGNLVLRNNGNYSDGAGNTVANSGSDIKAGLGKLTLTPGDDMRLDLSYLINSDKFHTPPVSPSPTQYDNLVTAQTAAAKFNYKPKTNELIDISVNAYWTGTDQVQTVTGSALQRDFNINTIGTDVYNTSRFATGGIKHAVTIGADVFKDTVKTTDNTGAGGGNSSAGAFTPSGERSAGGTFIQDKAEVTRWLEFIVAGRYDFYSLNGGATSTAGSHFSPKGTMVLKPFENTALQGLNFYGTYAEGYRAPAITETLISGVHPVVQAPFVFLPNPNLRPEVGHTLEAGFTGEFNSVFRSEDRVTVRGAVYQNNVDDFIDANYTGATYQFVNIGRGKLTGIEGEISYESPFLFGGVAGSMVRGVNDNTGTNLANIPADKIVTTLGFHFADQKGSVGARWFAVAAQNLVPPVPPGPPAAPLNSKAYNLVNLFASYAVNNNLNIALNFDNVFNENYVPYLETNAQPGRSVMFAVTTRFGK